MNSNRFRLRTSLRCDLLEDRTVPAQFNNPWADPTHLTVSFAADGTQALSSTSDLYASLDAQMPRSVWQASILRAFQTWSEVAGVNFGLVADGGQAFGINGAAQGDSRFGDIRIGALPMAGEFAQAIPPDPSLTGTLAGDIYFNSNATFTPSTLYGVALHEVGHALGLASNEDPTSVMYDIFNQNLTLSAEDVTAVRTLYGVRAPDANEGAIGNETIKDATRIKYNSSFDGSTPLVIFGDVTTATDKDVYYFPALDTYSGPVTVRLQSAGVSLLAAKISIIDAKGNVLATAVSSGIQGDTLSLTLPQVAAGGKYYVKVEAAPGGSNAVGRYGLGVTFDNLLKPSALSLDTVLRGPYDTISTQDLISLFQNPNGVQFNDDAGTNDTTGKATLLASTPGFAANTHFKATASISSSTDVDFYHIKAPNTQNGATVVLTATVRSIAPNGALERIEVYDSRQNRIAATILANGNGTFTVQAIGLAANTDYYIRVAGQTGNYQLDVSFGSKIAEVTTFSTGTIPVAGQLSSSLYIAQTQVFSFSLAATGTAGTPIQMTITDSSGHIVFSLEGLASDTVSGVTGFLPPGEYQVHLTSLGSSPVSFAVRGNAITDPIGPQPQNSATAPQYQTPQAPGTYTYPNGITTFSPFLFGIWLVI